MKLPENLKMAMGNLKIRTINPQSRSSLMSVVHPLGPIGALGENVITIVIILRKKVIKKGSSIFGTSNFCA